MDKKVRNSNIELLRMIAMLMIVGMHVLRRGGALEQAPFTSNYYFTWILNGICYSGVNLYVLISGYFLCKSEFSIKKVVKLWGTVFIYSVVLAIIVSCVTGTFNLQRWFYALFPITGREYWFLTTYFGLYLLFPFLNILIKGMNKRKHTQFLIVLLLIFCVIDNITFYSDWMNFGGAYSLPWFLVLYFVGAWFRLCYQPKMSKAKHLFCYIIITILIPVSKFAAAWLSTKMVGTIMFDDLAYSYNSILVALSSFLLFALVVRMDTIKGIFGKYLNTFGKSTLGVYLIHSNPFIVEWLWSYSPISDLTKSDHFILLVIAEMLIVFHVCLFLDFIARNTIGVVLKKPVEKVLFLTEKAFSILGIREAEKMKKQKVKIILAAYVNYPNAQNINCDNIAKNLDKNKFDVHVLYLAGCPINKMEYKRKRIKLHYINNHRFLHQITLWTTLIFGNYDIYYLPKPDVPFLRFIKHFKNRKLLVSSIESVITNKDETAEDYWHKGYMIQNMYDVFAISDCIAESIEQYYGKRTVVLPLGVRE